MDQRSVDFHEDDYGQFEILPAKNWEFCAHQLQQIGAFSEQHRAPGGVGWTDVFVRKQEPDTLASLALNADAVSRALSLNLLQFDRVTTGYSSYVEECRGTLAFGFDRDCAIFVSVSDAGAVSNIWLGLGGPNEMERKSLLSALRDLRTFSPLLLVDWAWGRLFLLDDQDGISHYLIERELHMHRISETMGQRRLQEAEVKAEQQVLEASTRRWWHVFR